MLFILGLITGLLLSILVVVTSFFIFSQNKAKIFQAMKTIEKRVNPAHLFMPLDDEELSRKEILEKAKEEGRDVYLSELYDENQ